MAARKTALGRRDEARAALNAVLKELAERNTILNTMLVDGAPAAEIGALDSAITGLRHSEKTERDRLALLDAEVEKEKQETVAKQHASQIQRFAALQAERVIVAKLVQKDIAKLWKDVSALVELSERARGGYHVYSPSARAGADAAEGAAMKADAIMLMVGHEIFRQTYTPHYGGRPGEKTILGLPGYKVPIGLEQQPHKVTPLADRMQIAADYAVRTLKQEIRPPGDKSRTSPVPAPVNGEQRPLTEAETRMRTLLENQNELAKDISPEGEVLYQACCKEIIAVDREIAAWRNTALAQNEATQ